MKLLNPISYKARLVADFERVIVAGRPIKHDDRIIFPYSFDGKKKVFILTLEECNDFHNRHDITHTTSLVSIKKDGSFDSSDMHVKTTPLPFSSISLDSMTASKYCSLHEFDNSRMINRIIHTVDNLFSYPLLSFSM